MGGPVHPGIDATRRKLNRYLTPDVAGLETERRKRESRSAGNPKPGGQRNHKEAMKSRAELLAELEEKRLENNKIPQDLNELSIKEPDAAGGYNPYDNPSLGKELPDGADITARRRRILLGKRHG